MRIGHAYDVHRFTEGDFITLGGIKIPCEFGIEAHSDGDVVIHAICDALLGAAALGDIGHFFPDSASENENRDSSEFLTIIMNKLKKLSYSIGNIDVTVIARVPKLHPYVKRMNENIAHILKISNDRVNVKATTNEGLGYIGNKEAIAAHAVVLITQEKGA